MTLRKKANDKSVRYVSKDGLSHTEQTPHVSKEKVSQTTKKNASNDELPQMIKKFTKNIIKEGFKISK